jgi:hypothetical protein
VFSVYRGVVDGGLGAVVARDDGEADGIPLVRTWEEGKGVKGGVFSL